MPPRKKKITTPPEKSPKTMWAVLRLHTDALIDMNFNPFPWTNGKTSKEIKLSFANGMIGCIPVFDTEEAAQAHAEGKYKILKVEAEYPT